MRLFIAIWLSCFSAIAYAGDAAQEAKKEVTARISFPKTVKLSPDSKQEGRSIGDFKIKIEITNNGEKDIKMSAVEDVRLAYGVKRDDREGHGINRNRKNEDALIKPGETKAVDWIAELYSPTAHIGTEYVITVGVFGNDQTGKVKTVRE